jgi:hypothetical protein
MLANESIQCPDELGAAEPLGSGVVIPNVEDGTAQLATRLSAPILDQFGVRRE